MAKAITVLLAAGVISVSNPLTAVAQHSTLQICLRNDAHVADDTLDEARRVVSDIYSQAGLMLLWCPPPPPQRLQIFDRDIPP